MGFSTTYLGHLDIEPPLNSAETAWLRAFRLTDRSLHPHDPYAVPMNPRAERLAHLTRDRHDKPDASSRSQAAELTRCDWQPCLDGCCLVWESIEKSNTSIHELRYLIDHFLRPGAHASRDGRADFAEFTFDHHVHGVVAAERDDTRELYVIVARDNTLSREALVPGDAVRPGGRVRR